VGDDDALPRGLAETERVAADALAAADARADGDGADAEGDADPGAHDGVLGDADADALASEADAVELSEALRLGLAVPEAVTHTLSDGVGV